MLPAVIKTERLVLRPWGFEDVPDVLAYANDEEWGRYLPVPYPYLDADARRFITNQTHQDPRTHRSWAIQHHERVVGGVDLFLLADQRIGEMGYSVARDHWGRGLATEAVRAVVGAAFESCPQLLRMRASADPRNPASTRVMEKSGMTREGVLRWNNFLRGEPVDEVWYGILRREWSDRG